MLRCIIYYFDDKPHTNHNKMATNEQQKKPLGKRPRETTEPQTSSKKSCFHPFSPNSNESSSNPKIHIPIPIIASNTNLANTNLTNTNLANTNLANTKLTNIELYNFIMTGEWVRMNSGLVPRVCNVCDKDTLLTYISSKENAYRERYVCLICVEKYIDMLNNLTIDIPEKPMSYAIPTDFYIPGPIVKSPTFKMKLGGFTVLEVITKGTWIRYSIKSCQCNQCNKHLLTYIHHPRPGGVSSYENYICLSCVSKYMDALNVLVIA